MALGEHFRKFKEHADHSRISLAIIDTFFELQQGTIQFIDREAFDIHLIKSNLQWTDDINTWFSFLLNREKNNFEISFSNYLLTIGIREKFLKFKTQKHLSRLKDLYKLMIFLEKQTEFSLFEHIEVIFPENELNQIYKLFFFNLFHPLDSQNRFDDPLSITTYHYFKNLQVQTEDPYNDIFYFLENILEHIQNIEYLVKFFLQFSRDQYILYFLINHKKLANTQLHIALLKSDREEYLNFVTYLIVFNQFVKLEDNLIEHIKQCDIDSFYPLLKSVILRFDFYQLNNENGYLFYLILTDLLQRPIPFLKQVVSSINPADYVLFSPVIVYVLTSLEETEDQVQLLFSTMLSILDASPHRNRQQLSTSIYPLLNYFLDFLKERETVYERLLNLLVGRFHHYLFPENQRKFPELELQTFFTLTNLFIYKFNTLLDEESLQKIFKMNLKLFEQSLQYSNPDIFQLNLFKIYIGFLNNTLNEHMITNEIFQSFINKIENVFHGNDLIKYQTLLLMTSNKDQMLNVNDLDLDMLGESTRKRLVEFTGITRKKIVIYPVFESEAYQISPMKFKLLAILKLFLIYDIFYPVLRKAFGEPLEFKRDQNKIYILKKGTQVKDEYPLDAITITPCPFVIHYINILVAFLSLILFATFGFRILIDGVLIGDTTLITSGGLLLFLALALDYFFYYFYIKFKHLYFYKVEIDHQKKMLYTKDINFIRLF